MSITFLPTAGTWTTHHYYLSDDDFGVVNGVYATNDEEPQVQCHNSGGLALVAVLDLAPLSPPDEKYIGSFEAEAVDALIERLQEEGIGTNFEPWAHEYVTRKRDAFMQMLLHCKLHACGFTWG